MENVRQMPFSSTLLPMKMGYRNARRRFCTPKIKIGIPLKMPKAQAAGIPNRLRTGQSPPVRGILKAE
jgi:hypothetical protein